MNQTTDGRGGKIKTTDMRWSFYTMGFMCLKDSRFQIRTVEAEEGAVKKHTREC
jgi:hypothetical protein